MGLESESSAPAEQAVYVRGEALYGPFRAEAGPGLAPAEDLEFEDDRLRRLDRATRLALRGAERALADAGSTRHDPSRDGMGLYLGNAYGAYEANLGHQRRVLEEGGAAASPALFTHTLANVSAGWISIVEGLKGPLMTFAGGTLACAEALLQAAADLAERGSGRLLTGGVHAHQEDVQDVLDRARAGEAFPVSEGAAFLVLEGGRGAPGDVVFEGGALARGPDVRGALETAWKRAGCSPGSVDACLVAGDPSTGAETAAALRDRGCGEVRSLAEETGDVGEASAAAGAVLACRRLRGGGALGADAAKGGRLLVTGTDPCGRRAFALLLSSPGMPAG